MDVDPEPPSLIFAQPIIGAHHSGVGPPPEVGWGTPRGVALYGFGAVQPPAEAPSKAQVDQG